VLSTDLQT